MIQTPLFLPLHLHFPPHLYFLTRDWPILSHWLQFLPTLLSRISFPDLSLLLAPSCRRQLAETHIRHLSSSPIHSFPLHQHPHQHPHHIFPPTFFACDGSMVTNNTSGKRTTTFAVTTPNSAFVASLHPSAHHTNILHGEIYGLIAASLVSSHVPNAHIFSDHLNSIKLLSTNPSLLTLRNNSARSLYRWLLSLWSSGQKPQLTHVRAHTNASDIPSQLNHIADSLATTSQTFPLLPPSVPVPTFFMDLFMLFSPSHGFVESSITSFVDLSLARSASLSFDTCHQPLPPLPLFDNTPPPPYPYTKTASSYSSTVQLYARSGQLDSRILLSARLKGSYQPWCRFGCPVLEDAHHLFVNCPKFSSLRAGYQKRLLDTIKDSLRHVHILSQDDQSFIFEKVRDLFTDSPVWPSCRTAYYLGILPVFIPSSRVGTRVHARIAHIAHIVCIQLAGRIWGEVRRQGFPSPSSRQNDHSTSQNQPVLLPSHLSRLFPSSSLSSHV
jgi:hypothetical protein